MRNYFDELDATIRKPEDILAASPILRDLCADTTVLKSLIAEYFSAALKHQEREGQRSSSNVLMLNSFANRSSNRVYLPALSFHEAGAAESIVNHSIYSILSPVNTSITVERYRLPSGWNPEIFDPTTKINYDGTIVLNPGDVLGVEPADICYHFVFARDTVIIKLQSSTIFQSLEWSFGADDKLAWQCISTEPKHSYAQHLCAAASRIGDPRLIEPLKGLLAHEQHFVRWAAGKALGEQSVTLAKEVMSHLSNDRHPHVANAARATLKKIEALEA